MHEDNSKNRILYVNNIDVHEDRQLQAYVQQFEFINVKNQVELAGALEDSPCLALVNLAKKDFDGISFIDEIRKRTKNLPILVLSDKGHPGLINKAAKFSIQGFLIKPIKAGEFMDKISSYLPSIPSSGEKTGISSPENNESLGANPWHEEASLNEIFFLGQTKMSQDKCEEALVCFEYLSMQKRFNNENEVILRERALFEKGRCNLKLKKYKTSVANFREFLKFCPKSTLRNDAWFYMGEIFLKAKNEENAKLCFHKAATLPNPKHGNTMLRAKKKLKQFGVNL